MSVVETVLVFVVIPLGSLALLAVLVYGPRASRAPRYRPGRPWDYDPVWYVPQHLNGEQPQRTGQRELTADRRTRAALPGGPLAPPASVLDAPTRTAKGGAHGSW